MLRVPCAEWNPFFSAGCQMVSSYDDGLTFPSLLALQILEESSSFGSNAFAVFHPMAIQFGVEYFGWLTLDFTFPRQGSSIHLSIWADKKIKMEFPFFIVPKNMSSFQISAEKVHFLPPTIE